MTPLRLDRIALLDDATLGLLWRGEDRVCWTLEDAWRRNARGVSCIPDGDYELQPHDSERYSRVWRVTCGGQDVPGRTAILVHAGNTVADTQGCILVGSAWSQATMSSVLLSDSRRALQSLRLLLGNTDTHSLSIRSREAKL